MVEQIRPLYEDTRSHFSKRINLAIRGWIYRWTYIPEIVRLGALEGVQNALEIGSGYGTKLDHSVRAWPDINFQAVEASPTMKEKGAHFYPKVAALTEIDDATSLHTIDNDSQDLLMYYQVLHHLNWSELEEAVFQARRVLRASGKIAVIETFIDEDHSPLSRIKKTVFNTIEPIYSLVSTSNSDGYQNQPRAAFINFMFSQGFTLDSSSQPFGKVSVSEILIFRRNSESEQKSED